MSTLVAIYHKNKQLRKSRIKPHIVIHKNKKHKHILLPQVQWKLFLNKWIIQKFEEHTRLSWHRNKEFVTCAAMAGATIEVGAIEEEAGLVEEESGAAKYGR